MLPRDKYNIFKQIFELRCKNGMYDVIFNELYKVFSARDGHVTHDIKEYQDEFALYLVNELKVKEFIKNDVWDRFKYAPSDILVVDMPNELTNDPKPYMYIVCIEDIHDIKFKGNGVIEWIVFHSGERMLRLTEDSYQEVKFDLKGEYEVIYSIAHNIGHCPATSITMDLNNILAKHNPLSPFVGNMDWSEYFETSKKSLDSHSAYPIYSGYETDCDYEGVDGSVCDGGYLKLDGVNLTDGTDIKECPVCGTKNMTGAGSFITIPQGENGNELKSAIQMLVADTDSLKYNTAECERIKKEIHNNSVGIGGMSIEEFSVNKEQLTASINSKQSVLDNLKGQFERLEEWIYNTVGKIKYGNAYKGSDVNYGTEFYLHTEDEFIMFYLKLKEKGIGNEILDAIQDEYYKAKFRDNKGKLDRILTIKHLDPLRHVDADRVQTMRDENDVSWEMYITKLNLTSFVMRFEREQGVDIVKFGENLDFNEKVNIINEQIKTYIDEYRSKETVSETVD